MEETLADYMREEELKLLKLEEKKQVIDTREW